MTYHIDLHTRDGQQLSFDCAPEQNLIDAAAAVSIILQAQCRQGNCGACHASVSAGEYALGAHNPDALPSGQPGAILMCCTTPQSDLRINLPYDHSKVLFQTVPRRSAEIVALETVAENTVLLKLRLDADADCGSAAEFEPGQFMEIEIPGSQERRAYSLANTGNWDGSLEFLIRLQPGGVFSAFLREHAQPGIKLAVRGPLGAFGIEPASMRPRWFVAGGTGLAPVLSMLRRMAEFQEMHEARLFFGVNRESELFSLDELARLKIELPQLKVDVCVWKPEGDWQGFRGTPADALQQALTEAPAQPDIYLCGPAPLVNAVEKTAVAFGLPMERVFSERFLPG
ncbi:MAG: 2Fe-2S iron-sulfur cluster binding domain-containing protein [Pseudomonadota bacterium]|nr:2Fe-2S iron-sulfur cluster binding domain-containing protein [Pseudomonadota bacterium]